MRWCLVVVCTIFDGENGFDTECGISTVAQNEPTDIFRNLLPTIDLNSLNAELNPIFHLLVLLGAHRIFHVSGLRVK
jgi:hypothetical protein